MTTGDEWIRRAKAAMTPNYSPPPFVLSHGQGSRVWDTDGREYLDFAGGIGVNALGHAHPKVVEAIAAQAGRLCHTSNAYYHPTYIALCEKVCQLSFAERVYLCNSGAEAVEAALKLARRHFFDRGVPRSEFVSAEQSFHGRTYGALSVTGQASYRTGFDPLVPGVRFVPFDDIVAMGEAVGPHTAAVIVEPIQGNGGVRMPSDGYLSAVRQLCTQRGALLIFDEVQTGIGRTGKWFSHLYDEVTPDILCLAKALGGGLPLGAMATTEALSVCLQPGSHATTFGGNPVACAAGLATLQVLESDHLVQRAFVLGGTYRSMLSQLQAQHPQIQEIRGRGLLVGLRCDEPVAPWQAACRKRGLLTTAAGSQVLRLFPPLNVTEADLLRSVELLDKALVP